MIRLFSKKWNSLKEQDLELYLIGWFEFENIIYYDLDPYIVSLFKEKKKNIKDLIQKFNGSFSFIFVQENKISIIADRNRSYPVLYFIKDNEVIVTDHISKYSETTNTVFSPSDILAEQYFVSSYIFGKYTLFESVFSTQAGEIVSIDRETKIFTSQSYFQWLPNMNLSAERREKNNEAKKQDRILQSVIKRMIKSCPNVNNWIIPLSGGYDSRVIVNYLYKLGVKNVICFSYGIKNNKQSEISQQVAEALGYEWHFIDYEEWTAKIQKTSLIEGYIDFAFNGCSTSHLQDFTAVYALKQLNILKENDVFIPGHTLDFITGGHLTESMQDIKTVKDVIPNIKRHLSNLGYYSYNRKLKKHIINIIKRINISSKQIPEYFNWKERQSKFIVNSVRCYEFFGFDWRVPLWDKEIVDYWMKVEFDYRLDRKMFKEIFKNYLVVDELKSVPFFNDLKQENKPSLKQRIKNAIPINIKNSLRKYGFKTTSYYNVNEGLSIVYSDKNEKVNDFLSHEKHPIKLQSFLLKYYRNQEVRYFGINTVTSLLLLKKYYNK